MNRNEVIAKIKTALKERTGSAWSVTGGRGTAWGWITVSAPPARLVCSRAADCGPACTHGRGYMATADMALLALALGLDHVHNQGVSIAASSAHYREYLDRAQGLKPEAIATPYWD